MNFEESNIDKETLESEDKYPFNVNPEMGKLISGGYKYDNIPRMRNSLSAEMLLGKVYLL